MCVQSEVEDLGYNALRTIEGNLFIAIRRRPPHASSMFWRFAVCLAPVLLVALIALLTSTGALSEAYWETWLMVCILLVLVGALLSAIFVTIRVSRSIKEPTWARVVASILVFIVVGIGYIALGGFGGCLMAAAGT